jgi:hypothetical protein
MRQRAIQDLYRRVIRTHDFGRQHESLHALVERFEQLRALSQPSTQGLIRQLNSKAPEHLCLAVHRQVIGHFGYNHLGQDASRSRTLLNWLRRLASRANGTGTSVFLTCLFDHQQLRRNVLVTLADFLANVP